MDDRCLFDPSYSNLIRHHPGPNECLGDASPDSSGGNAGPDIQVHSGSPLTTRRNLARSLGMSLHNCSTHHHQHDVAPRRGSRCPTNFFPPDLSSSCTIVTMHCPNDSRIRSR